MNNARPTYPGDLLRAVGAPVVRNHDFASDAGCGDCPLSLPNARLERVPLVETGHHDAELDVIRTLGRLRRTVSRFSGCLLRRATSGHVMARIEGRAVGH